MTVRRVIRLAALLGVLVLLVAPLLAAYHLLHSESGLQFALARLERIPGIRIEASGAGGTLAGPLTIARLVIEHEAARIEAEGVRLDASTSALLHGEIELQEAAVDRLEVTLRAREPQPPGPPAFLPRFLSIDAPDVRLAQVGVVLVDGRRVGVAELRAALAMTRWRIDLTDLLIDDPAGHVEGNLTLRATEPLGLRAAANGHWRLPDERTYRFATAVRGNLDRLGTTVTLAEPASLSFVGNALTLGDAPRVVGTLRAVEFDGSPWLPAGRIPRLSGSVALDASATAFGLDGTLTADEFGDGPVRLQGSGRWQAGGLQIESLRAWEPRSALELQLSGSARLADPAPELALAGEWTALRWPLTGQPVVESAVGSLTLNGALPYAFEVQARARSAAVTGRPEAEFDAAGSIDREQLVIGRLSGTALRGRVTGGGMLSWTGEQRWDARVDARDLDIGVLRPDLPGRVSAQARLEGRGFSATAPWTVQLASLSGNLLGRALTGRGEIAHRDGSYLLRGVRVANGPSHVDVDGRWGPQVDLRWNADLRSLKLLHPDLAGTLASSGRASGSSTRPRVVGDLHGRGLQLGAVALGSLEGDVDVDLSDAQQSRVELRAMQLDLGPLVLDDAVLRARGLASDHALALSFSSSGDGTQRIPGFDGRVEVSGDYDADAKNWQGQLTEAAVTFPDGGASLLQPAAILAGPEQVSVAPICLQSGEARLCVEGGRHGAPAAGWRVIYSAQDWPLRRLLRSVLGWREFDGRLQAAGWFSGSGIDDWVGGSTLFVEDAIVDMPVNQFRTERVRLGGGRLDLFAVPEELRADLELGLTEDAHLRGELVARREPGVAPADYPLEGLLEGTATSLESAALFVPEIDDAAGSLDVAVRIAGTLGDPRFDGEFHVRDGRLDLYRTNLLLSGLTLDGRFVGDELVFEGAGRAARGSLTLDGHFRWPGNVMTGQMHLRGQELQLADTPDFRVVASPDLLFTAGPDGFEVTGSVLVPQARITPKDLSTTIGTSPDERIVGVEDEEPGPSTLERLRTRIRVELGDNVRVNSHGLRAHLAGEVTVVTQPGDVVRGQGEIRVVTGEYRAFGQFVRIERGVLSFDMSPLDDPRLDLVAKRDIPAENLVVALNVRGTLSQPFVTVSATPPLPEAEALSYLLTGRSLNTLQSSEAASLNRAAESLAISGGGLLLGGIGSRIGLDEVTVEQTGEDDTMVVLGKYLTPRLFVSYGISIVEAINTIKLRYTLNERWSLKAEAGLEQSADVEYRIER